jgi:hypothetical protein
MESLKFSHLYGAAATDSNDPVADKWTAIRVLAKAVTLIAAKLDADGGVTDTNYKALSDAVTV